MLPRSPGLRHGHLYIGKAQTDQSSSTRRKIWADVVVVGFEDSGEAFWRVAYLWYFFHLRLYTAAAAHRGY